MGGQDQRDQQRHGLSLAPMRGLRPVADHEALASLLCPPYDVIDARRRDELLAANSRNAVAVILPDPTPAGYEGAAQHLASWVADGDLAVDDAPVLYVYEMREPDGHVTRGLLGAVELRAPEDGVILPHENTMAGPVADRLAVMTATDADLEPIYLVYDGGGAASALVARTGDRAPTAQTTTPDGIRHRLWLIPDANAHADVARDLDGRSALIADGHHRYATYRERQRLRREIDGAGPWDRGLALLVDTSEYGPQVHAIHRTVAGLTLADALRRLEGWATVEPVADVATGLAALAGTDAGVFAVVLSDGSATYAVRDDGGTLARAAQRADEDPSLSRLDVTVLHRALVERALQLVDDVDTVGYAHDVADALAAAEDAGGFAVLVRPTWVEDVAAVAAAGARMPRKSTLFTPKPASGLVLRRLSDQ